MLNKLSGIVLLISLVFVYSIPAQERPKAENLLRFFPEGDYQYLAHHDYAGHASQPAFVLYNKYRSLEKELRGKRAVEKRLPERFYRDDYSITFAELFRGIEKRELIRVDDPTSREAIIKEIMTVTKKYPNIYDIVDWQVAKPEDGEFEITFRVNIGESITVFRSAELVEILKESLEAGEIEKTGIKIRKRAIYRMEGTGKRNRSKPFYLYPTPSNELLVASRIQGIRKMLAVEEGAVPGILEDRRYSDLMEAIPEISLNWDASFPQLSHERYLATRKNLGMTDEDFEKLQDHIKQQPWVEVVTTDIADEIVWRMINIYENEEIARLKFKPKQPLSEKGSRSDMPDEFYAYEKLEHAKTTIKREHNWIIKSVLWDEEYLSQRLEYYKAWEEFQREKRKEHEELEAAAKAAQEKEQDK